MEAAGISEAIDWATALAVLDRTTLDPEAVDATRGVLLKYEDDIARLNPEATAQLIDAVRGDVAGSP